jgi:hypothetical protein
MITAEKKKNKRKASTEWTLGDIIQKVDMTKIPGNLDPLVYEAGSSSNSNTQVICVLRGDLTIRWQHTGSQNGQEQLARGWGCFPKAA